MLVNSYIFPSGGIPDPNQKAITANATSDPNYNEANATTGWLASRATLSVESGTINVGSYSLKITSNVDSGGTSYAYYVFTGTNGDTFDISFDYYSPSSNSGNTQIQNLGVTPNGFTSPLATNVWTTFTSSVTAGTGPYWIRIFVDNSVSSAGDGNIVYIDNLSIIKTN